jgi:hypothetical protein
LAKVGRQLRTFRVVLESSFWCCGLHYIFVQLQCLGAYFMTVVRTICVDIDIGFL